MLLREVLEDLRQRFLDTKRRITSFWSFVGTVEEHAVELERAEYVRKMHLKVRDMSSNSRCVPPLLNIVLVIPVVVKGDFPQLGVLLRGKHRRREVPHRIPAP